MSGHHDLGLGRLITTPQHKDATHVALAPITAGEKLRPGEHVLARTDGVAVKPSSMEEAVGIVDPFLREPVQEGQKFWLFVYPNTVTGMRHEWEHPMFPDPKAWENFSGTGERRIREIAADLGISYEKLMQGTADWIAHGRYLSEGPVLEGAVVPDDFWEAYEKVVGKTVPSDKIQPSFFSCSC